MKYYLSSFELGNETEKLASLLKDVTGKIGYVPNALDFTKADPSRKMLSIESDINDIEKFGAKVEIIDLKDYFGKQDELRKVVQGLGGLYVRGGNSFVLRQAMFLSGMDKVIVELQQKKDFLYVAYSAGVCVLTRDMSVYAITDDAKDFPYSGVTEQMWEGIGIFDFAFEPHYKSDHPESASTDLEVEYCINNKILFKAYRDGEVMIVE